MQDKKINKNHCFFIYFLSHVPASPPSLIATSLISALSLHLYLPLWCRDGLEKGGGLRQGLFVDGRVVRPISGHWAEGGRGAVPVFERLKRVWFMARGSPSGTGLEVLCVTAPRRESKKTFNLPITHKVPTVRKCVRMCLLEAKQPPVPPLLKKHKRKAHQPEPPTLTDFYDRNNSLNPVYFALKYHSKTRLLFSWSRINIADPHLVFKLFF